eukprot:TRINITY_DN76652_c0_g1_i1.p1 TRINITY_DN76652_c0_g1~~TRINITY_DN76652_c0_g1_i1.p1  ORF type:complete len:393 (+),score=21.96 TRINITY_DN76652_c0_g1_i1:78-1256(+)
MATHTMTPRLRPIPSPHVHAVSLASHRRLNNSKQLARQVAHTLNGCGASFFTALCVRLSIRRRQPPYLARKYHCLASASVKTSCCRPGIRDVPVTIFECHSMCVQCGPSDLINDRKAQKSVGCLYVSDKIEVLVKTCDEIGVFAKTRIAPGELLIAETQAGELSTWDWPHSPNSLTKGSPAMPSCLSPRLPSQLPERYLGLLPLRALPAQFWETSVGMWLVDYLRFSTNAFSSGLIVVGSFVNHSCAPNARHGTCQISQETGSFSVDIHYADADIDAGEEIVTCYMEELLPLPSSLRRVALQIAMGFCCQCKRCVQSESGHGEIPTRPWTTPQAKVDDLLRRAAKLAPRQVIPQHPCFQYVAFSFFLMMSLLVLMVASIGCSFFLVESLTRP